VLTAEAEEPASQLVAAKPALQVLPLAVLPLAVLPLAVLRLALLPLAVLLPAEAATRRTAGS
jgi:hypothetical protein